MSRLTIVPQKRASTVGDAAEETGPMSQRQQEGGHPCPKSPKEVILHRDSPVFASTGPGGRGRDLLVVVVVLGLVVSDSAGFTTALTGKPILDGKLDSLCQIVQTQSLHNDLEGCIKSSRKSTKTNLLNCMKIMC